MSDTVRNYIFFALAIILIVCIVKLYGKFLPNKNFNYTKLVARVGVFSAMAAILYCVPIFQFSLPIFPSFLEFHFDEIVPFIAGFAYGPVVSFFVILVKTLLKFVLVGTGTAGVGELSDFILGLVQVLPAVIIYKKKRNLKGVALGFTVSTLLHLVVAMLLNVYVLIPFYVQFYFNGDSATLLVLCQAANPAIQDIGWGYAFFAVLPFNALKDVVVIVVTFLIYRNIHHILRFENRGDKKKA